MKEIEPNVKAESKQCFGKMDVADSSCNCEVCEDSWTCWAVTAERLSEKKKPESEEE